MQGEGSQTVITEDVEIVGTIKAVSGLRLEGKLNGDLNCSGDVVIGKTGSVKGNISVNSIVVAGQIGGNIMAKDRIELSAAARINGDIKAKRLTVEDGVSFVGKAEVNPSGAAIARPAAGADVPAAPRDGEGDDAAKGKGNLFSGKK